MATSVEAAPTATPELGEPTEGPWLVAADAAPPQGLAAMRLYEVWRAITRYRPVAAAIAVLLAAAIILPGAKVIGDDSTTSAAGQMAASARSGGGVVASEETVAASVDAPAADAIDDSAAAVTIAAATAPSTSSAASASSGPSASAATTAVDSRHTAPAATPPAASVPAATVTKTDPTFKVRELGWATAQAGNPLSSAAIPENSLPIAKRLGDVDKIAFVRLAGASQVLQLKLVDDPGANRLADQASVRACQIIDPSWKAQPGMSLDDAPAYDKTECVDAEVAADGTWTFNLSRFDDVTDARGIALVPAANAPSDFQVVLRQ